MYLKIHTTFFFGKMKCDLKAVKDEEIVFIDLNSESQNKIKIYNMPLKAID